MIGYQKYHIQHKHVPAPCGKDCPDRTAGCAMMCASWQLYTSIRDNVYNKRREDAESQQFTRAESAYKDKSVKELNPRWRQRR